MVGLNETTEHPPSSWRVYRTPESAVLVIKDSDEAFYLAKFACAES